MLGSECTVLSISSTNVFHAFNTGLWEGIYGNVRAIVALLTRALVVVSSLPVLKFIVETAIHNTVCVCVS